MRAKSSRSFCGLGMGELDEFEAVRAGRVGRG